MWFRRKYKNRRFKRYEVLEVKLRSRQTRAARLRMLGLALGVSLATLTALFLGWRAAHWALNRLVFENPAFAVRVIDVLTDGIIPPDQLRRWAGVKPGENLLALDLGHIKRNLELSPLIQSATVERMLPDKLQLRVVEREPVARVHALQARPNNGGLVPVIYQLDDAGYVMIPLENWQHGPRPGEANEQLPLLLGLPQTELRPGRPVESPPVQAALRLIREFEHSPMAGLVDLKQINVSSPDILRVTTGQGSEIVFSLNQLDTQMRRWRMLHDYGLKNNKAIASLDLSVTENIPARWIESSAVPPVHAKPGKPPHYRKKNV